MREEEDRTIFRNLHFLGKKRQNGDLEVFSKKKSKGNGVPTTTYAEGIRRPPTALVVCESLVGGGRER